MSRKIFILFIIFFHITLFANECKVLQVGGTNDWYPINFIDKKTNKTEGIAYDLIREIGDKLDVKVEIYAFYPWKRMLDYVEDGKLDMVSALYWTEERAKSYTYTEPYLINEARAFVLKDKKFKLEKLEDLIGLRGGIPFGGSYGGEFDSFAKKNLKLLYTYKKEQHIGMLLLDRFDYFILDYDDGMIYLKNNGLEDKIVALDYPISTTSVYFAFSKQSPCLKLLDSINQLILDSKSDGTLDSIIHKYTK
ncbi:MAG: amino acid ABC transporter substrate-binding protein [Campylobacteraceae bacterium]|nr:amino acid ABC transporter substrate-binding protein [Campylobacteraceae bacterium]